MSYHYFEPRIICQENEIFRKVLQWKQFSVYTVNSLNQNEYLYYISNNTECDGKICQNTFAKVD